MDWGSPYGAGATMGAWRGGAGGAGTVGRTCPVQLEAGGRPEIAVAKLQASRGHAFTLCGDEIQVGDPCTLNRGGLGGDAQVVEVAPLLLALVDQCHRVGLDYASLLFKDADCIRHVV